MRENNIFADLSSINVNDYTEEKGKLTYLSWASAWQEVCKRYPDTRYEVKRFDGKPYLFDESLGYIVFTSVTIGDLTHEMWLPVMDGANKAMKDKPYTYDTRYKKGLKVEAATMFDINKTIMRCLTKNLAMFGLRLYIYKGEDLPEEPEDMDRPLTEQERSQLMQEAIKAHAEEAENTIKEVMAQLGVQSTRDIKKSDLDKAISLIKGEQ